MILGAGAWEDLRCCLKSAVSFKLFLPLGFIQKWKDPGDFPVSEMSYDVRVMMRSY